MIRFEGWRVELFSSAEDFLAYPRTRTPSCLVLDVGLPDLNGLDLQERIAVDRLDMPIIFITGRGDVPMTRGAEFSAHRRDALSAMNGGRQAYGRVLSALNRDRETLRRGLSAMNGGRQRDGRVGSAFGRG